MAKSPNWTIEEDNILKKYYPDGGISKCAPLLTRSEKAINVRSSRLGLKLNNAWNKRLSTPEYLIKLNSLNSTIIPIGEYILDSVEIKHKCLKCDSIWMARPNNILKGSGCPTCNKGFGWLGKFSPVTNKAYLYVLKISRHSNTDILKIGITSSQNTTKRFSAIRVGIGDEFKEFQKIAFISMTTEKIIDLERILLRELEEFRIYNKYTFGGHTELMNIEALPTIMMYILDYFVEEV